MIKKLTTVIAMVITLISFGTATSAEEQQVTPEQEVSTASSISWWWE